MLSVWVGLRLDCGC